MKRKALYFVLTLLVMAVFSLVGCGGGGGHSNPASSNIAGNARVSGVVYDSSNNPVQNAKVSLVLSSKALVNSLTSNTNSTTSRLATTDNQTEFTTNTDNKGQYTFVNVPYGEYTLSAVTANGAQVVTNLLVNSAEIDTDKIVLAPFGSISGTVTCDGQNLSGALVCLEGTSYCSITDTLGKFKLNNVPSNTEFNLIAMASGCETFPGKTVKIIASESLDITDEELALTASSQKAYSVICNIIGTGRDLTGLLVFAYSADGNNTYVGRVGENLSCTIKITASGTYTLIPAYIINDCNQTGTATGTVNVTDKQIQKSEQLTMNLTMGAVSSIEKYASLKVELGITSSDDFTASLYDSTGHENKKTIKSGSPAIFENLPAGFYALAVYSDTMLKVETGIELTAGKTTTKTISPVTVLTTEDNVSVDSGIATLKLNYSSDSPATDADKDNLYFSLISKGYDGYTTLLDESLTTTEFKVTKSNITKNFSIDNLNAEKDTIAYIKIFFKNGLSKNVFEKDFRLAEPQTIATNAFKRVSLMTSDTAHLTQSGNNIILFKSLYNNSDNTIHYLVVTKDTAYVFSSNGSIEKTVNFSEKFSELLPVANFNVEIRYGNASYLDDGSNQALAIQFIAPTSNAGPNTQLYIYKYSFDTLIGSGDPEKLLPTDTGTAYYPNSANKLLLTSSNSCLSVCDNYVLVNQSGNWSQVYFGEKFTNPEGQVNDPSFTKTVIASFTTIIPKANSFKLFYLNKDAESLQDTSFYGCNSYRIYLGISDINPSLNSTTVINDGIAIGETVLADAIGSPYYYDIQSNPNNGNDYYCCSLLNTNAFQFSIADCLDNAEATNKVFIYENLLDVENNDPKYVFSDSIYSGTNIESSYRSAGNFDTWIERNSEGHFLKLRNKNSYKEQKIKISQVLNSTAYLEGSIGYTDANKQIHILTKDSDNIQVLVLNCIESNN